VGFTTRFLKDSVKTKVSDHAHKTGVILNFIDPYWIAIE